MKTMSRSPERRRKFREKLKKMKKSWRLIKKKDRERKTKQVKEWASSLSEKEKALLKLKKTASQR